VTKQLAEWSGDFGDAYVERNPVTAEILRRKLRDWSTILSNVSGSLPATILEVGANVGQNLAALSQLSDAKLFAVEPNDHARARLVSSGLIDPARAFKASAASLPFESASMDLVFTSGVLIHIAPDDLLAACREIHRVARRYVLSIEYFSHTPIEKPYRGLHDMLFLRDYGSYWLDNFDDLRIAGYGFFWRRVTGGDLNWWLFSKPG
jgi:spore coat polysaccharide biosynthesis protein SpsF